MMSKEAQILNQAVMDRLEDAQGRLEVQDESLTYIRTIFRESSFARKIIPPQGVTRMQVNRAVNTDTVEFIRDIEPDSAALALNFRSEAPAEYVQGRRYRIPFFTISSKLYEKTEAELLAYDSPIIKIIERNSVTDIAEVEDDVFLQHVDLAVVGAGQAMDAPGGPTASIKLTREFVTEGFSLIDAVRKPCSVILMSTVTFNDILAWQSMDFGDHLLGKIVTDGYTYDQLLGKKLVVTTKTNLVPYGYVYYFTEPQYLGDFFILNSTRFFIDKFADMVRWKVWEIIGIGIGDIRGCARQRFGTAAPAQ